MINKSRIDIDIDIDLMHQMSEFFDRNEIINKFNVINNDKINSVKKKKIISSKKELFNNLSNQKIIEIITENPLNIQFIKNPSKEIEYLAVKLAPNSIRFIKNSSEELKTFAVTLDPRVIKFIDNPSYSLQMLAVTLDGSVVSFLKDPSEEFKIIAIKQDIKNIHIFKSYSDRILILAADINLLSIKSYNLSENVQMYIARKYGYRAFKELKGKIKSKIAQLAIIEIDPRAYFDFKELLNGQKEDFIETALKSNPYLIKEFSPFYQKKLIKKVYSYFKKNEAENWIFANIEIINENLLKKILNDYPNIIKDLILYYANYLPLGILKEYSYIQDVNSLGLLSDDN